MTKNPFIGQMDRVIQIKKKVVTQTETKAEVSSEVLVCEPFAFMQDISGGEEVDGKVRHLINRTYTVRWNPLITEGGTKLIVVDQEVKFEIVHIIELGRQKHLEIRVKSYE